MEMAAKGSRGRNSTSSEWAEDHQLHINRVTSRGCNSGPEDRGRIFRRGQQRGGPERRRGTEETLSTIFRKDPDKRLHIIPKCVNPTRVKKLNEVTGMVEKWRMTTWRASRRS